MVAIGGAGDDTFVLEPPHDAKTEATPPPQHPLGVILDFTAGDRLAGANGHTVNVLNATALDDVLANLRGFTFTGHIPPPVTPGFRVEVDLDGDNLGDGFLMVAGTGAAGLVSHLPAGAKPPPYPDPTAHPDTVVSTNHVAVSPGDFLLG